MLPWVQVVQKRQHTAMLGREGCPPPMQMGGGPVVGLGLRSAPPLGSIVPLDRQDRVPPGWPVWPGNVGSRGIRSRDQYRHGQGCCPTPTIRFPVQAVLFFYSGTIRVFTMKQVTATSVLMHPRPPPHQGCWCTKGPQGAHRTPWARRADAVRIVGRVSDAAATVGASHPIESLDSA